jgi:hypothetical protein
MRYIDFVETLVEQIDQGARDLVMRWDPESRLVRIARQCVAEGSARSVDQALCVLYETSLVEAWWDELTCWLSGWMGRSKVFHLDGAWSCSAIATSPDDLLSCVGVSRNEVFDLQLVGGVLVVKCDRSISVAHGFALA